MTLIFFRTLSLFSCMKKTSRGGSRTQRRRRSKSPILHLPRFLYSGTAAASSPSGSVKQQRLAVPEPPELHPRLDDHPAQLGQGSVPDGPVCPLVFGSRVGYKEQEVAAIGDAPSGQQSSPEESSGAQSRAPQKLGPVHAADFRALSEEVHPQCRCAWTQEGGRRGVECQCGLDRPGWTGVEVYSFTGLRDVISECERSFVNHEDPPRTVGATSGRSCSEQARTYVDDITIEDLSGYMEFYLYIPKKMSHMAEMMYT